MVIQTMKERLKPEVLYRVMDVPVDISKAVQILGLSDRSIYRVLSKVRIEGSENSGPWKQGLKS